MGKNNMAAPGRHRASKPGKKPKRNLLQKPSSNPRKTQVSHRDAPSSSSSRPRASESSKGSSYARMANPAHGKKTGRNKRHGNPDLSDADSLPSESDQEPLSSDEEPEDRRSHKKLKKRKEEDAELSSDVDEFLNEKEDGAESSDEDEGAGDLGEPSQDKVTTKTVKEWRTALQEKPTPANLKVAIRAFVAAVAQLTGQSNKSHGLIIDGGAVFNSVVALCLSCVGPALSRLVRMGKNSKPKDKILQLKKSKKWKVLHVPMRTYLTGMTELVTRLHDESIVRRVLKHISELLPYFSCNPKASKTLFKHLIQLWSSGKESLRLPAFMTLLRFLRMNGDEWLIPAIKKMYVAYVSNSKLTSPTTWPLIRFMAASLVEVLSIKLDVTYQQAFVYIRQMGIHVRNATNQKNKEMQAKVFNWPFMHCIYLWSKLLSDVYPNPVLLPLVHPLIQVVTSTIKINPVRKYYPLMFHCVRALNLISAKTDIFIPTVPVILSALQSNDLNKKPKTTSFKPFEFSSMLKFSDSQLLESNYRVGVADQIYEVMVEYVRTQSHKIGYPELVIVPCIQLRKFLKECKVSEISKKFKQLLSLMDEQSTFLNERRKQITFKFTDVSAVNEWEKNLKLADSPFSKFYGPWKEARRVAQQAVQSALDVPFEDGHAKESEDNEIDDDEQEDFWANAEEIAEEPAGPAEVDGEREDEIVAMDDLSDEEEPGDAEEDEASSADSS